MPGSSTAPPATDFGDLILAPDLYEELQVTRKTIFDWIRYRNFPKPIVVGRRTRYFRRSEVADFLEKQRQGGPDAA